MLASDRTTASEQGRRATLAAKRAVSVVADSPARLVLVANDGRIATLSKRLSSELGFDRPGDLTGLNLTSLWHHRDRLAVVSAFENARSGRSGHAAVDMGYLSGTPQLARVSFAPAQGGRDILMTFDWTAAE